MAAARRYSLTDEVASMKFLRIALLALLLAPSAAFAQVIGTYPNAQTPLFGTEQMIGNQSTTYPCVACTVTITPSMLAGYVASLTTDFSILYNNNGAISGLIPTATGSYCLDWTNLAAAPTLATCGGGSMVYPGAGIPVSTGTAWGTSITTLAELDTELGVTLPTLAGTNTFTGSLIQRVNRFARAFERLAGGRGEAVRGGRRALRAGPPGRGARGVPALPADRRELHAGSAGVPASAVGDDADREGSVKRGAAAGGTARAIS
ncbi:MAG: hypothetical protein B7X10_01765, partial [Burkholderiales bacterium 21-58-4]